MANQNTPSSASGTDRNAGTTSAPRPLSLPHAVGAASLAAAGLCAWWLRAGDGLPSVSPLRTLGLLVVCAYLVSATLVLFEDR